MTVINTNTSAMRAANASISANKSLSMSMERLSTGKRINSAKDDAAGLAISTSMNAQIRGMNQAIRNSNDGISLVQTADGALSEVSNMLQRVRELAVQSTSGTYSVSDRANIQAEVTALTDQLSKTLQGAEFNGVKLFNTDSATAKTTSIQVGANAGNRVDISVQGIDLSNVTTQLNVGINAGSVTALAAAKGTVTTNQADYDSKVAIYNDKQQAYATALAGGDGTAITAAQGERDTAKGDVETAKTTLDNSSASYSASEAGYNDEAVQNANSTISSVDNLMKTVNTARASLGAGQSRLESVVNDLTSRSTNLSDAKSRIEDADFSTESTNLAKAQILSQASTAMLAQANQSAQGVLKLLG